MSDTPIQNTYGRVPNAEQGVGRAIRRRFHLIRWDVVDLARRYGGHWKAAALMFCLQVGLAFLYWWQTHSTASGWTIVAAVGLILAVNGVVMVELNSSRTKVVAQAKDVAKGSYGCVARRVG